MAEHQQNVKQCVLERVILKPGKVSEQDITVIIQDQRQKQGTGVVVSGKCLRRHHTHSIHKVLGVQP